MTKIFKGIPVSPGYAFGNVQILKPAEKIDLEKNIVPQQVDSEIERFRSARSVYHDYLRQLIMQANAKRDELAASLFEAHDELLCDEELEHDILTKIRECFFPACRATAVVFDEIIDEMGLLEDEYARQRSDDFRQIKNRLLAALAGKSLESSNELSFDATVLIGGDLTPADTASLDKNKLAGLVSETGGITSHIAIFSQNLGVPAVVGLREITNELRDGDEMILDGCEGIVVLSPDDATMRQYRQKQSEYAESLALLEQYRDMPIHAADGTAIQFLANIGDPHDLESVVRYGANGIGLFRTEFLFMNSATLPDEERQFRVYRKIASQMHGKPVVIRTVDIGGDKPLRCFPFPAEANPFLGWRACRIYETHPELIMPQLRAILRAAKYGDLRVMFPMIISCEEVTQILALIEQAKEQLRTENIPFAENIATGIMVETPAAAMMIDDLLSLVDFCSLGTNDLTQYTLAVDRGNEGVSHLYDAMHPAVLLLIKRVIDAAKRLNKEASLCGELAGNDRATMFLLDAGLTKFSVTPSKIPSVKKAILSNGNAIR